MMASPAPSPASGDFAGGFAPRTEMAQQFLYPTGRLEPARFVRLGEQLGDVAPQLRGLLGREVPRKLVQQADQLTDTRGPGDAPLAGEPALELQARSAAGRGAIEEVAQAVRADGDGLGRAPQRNPRCLTRDRVTQQRHGQRGHAATTSAQATPPWRAL